MNDVVKQREWVVLVGTQNLKHKPNKWIYMFETDSGPNILKNVLFAISFGLQFSIIIYSVSDQGQCD